jgi:hypothetical protein
MKVKLFYQNSQMTARSKLGQEPSLLLIRQFQQLTTPGIQKTQATRSVR